MIQCKAVHKVYTTGLWRQQKAPVLEDIHLHIPKGYTYGLIGLSGSGKSTLAKLTLGLEMPTSGTVYSEGVDTRQLLRENPLSYRREHQILFQFPGLMMHPNFSVEELLLEPIVIHGQDDPTLTKERIPRILEELELPSHIVQRKATEISGGQLQRLALGRSLLLDPKYIVLDEPTSMLDSVSQMKVVALLQDLQQRRGLTYLLITHDLQLARYMADCVGVMQDGRIVEEGRDVLSHPTHEFTKELLAHNTIL